MRVLSVQRTHIRTQAPVRQTGERMVTLNMAGAWRGQTLPPLGGLLGRSLASSWQFLAVVWQLTDPFSAAAERRLAALPGGKTSTISSLPSFGEVAPGAEGGTP